MSKRILYALPMPRGEEVVAQSPSAAREDAPPGAGVPHCFEKELIREGAWVHPTKKFTFRVTPGRMRGWLKTFARMKAGGLKVPLPFGHSYDPRDNAGFLEDLRLEGNRLIGVLAVARPEDAERVGTTIRDVSVCVNPNFVDAHGNRFGEAIEHVALTNYPMVEGQPNFAPVERIAAGEDGDAEVWTFAIERLKDAKPATAEGDGEPKPGPLGAGESADETAASPPPTEEPSTPDRLAASAEAGEETEPKPGPLGAGEVGEEPPSPPTALEPAEVAELAALRLELARERSDRIAAEVVSHVTAGRIPPAAAEAARALLTCERGTRFDLDRQSEVALDIAASCRYLLSLLPAGAAVDLADRTRRLRPMPNPGNTHLAAGRATAAAARRMLESRGYTVTLSDDGANILEANKET